MTVHLFRMTRGGQGGTVCGDSELSEGYKEHKMRAERWSLGGQKEGEMGYCIRSTAARGT